MTELEIRAELRLLRRKMRRVKENPSGDVEMDTDALRDLKAQARELTSRLSELEKNKVTATKELAEKYGFSLIQHGKDWYSMTANWEFSDGYKPSTMAMSLECCYQYLIGYGIAKYEP